ncbi:MAG TPA: hypothetical protein VMG59_06915 [Phycisphaerae bacterium]|nr:hypothetical protein [Phycisphaerae bacterium]
MKRKPPDNILNLARLTPGGGRFWFVLAQLGKRRLYFARVNLRNKSYLASLKYSLGVVRYHTGMFGGYALGQQRGPPIGYMFGQRLASG